jgi:predicted DNA-binding transcriptional regulator AlpA
VNTNEIKSTLPTALEPLLTIEDLERILRVHRRTISRMCKRGEFPQPMRIGIGMRWRVEDVADVLQRHRDQPSGQVDAEVPAR